MSQYYSRIHIKVKSPEVWNKFADTYDAEFNLASLANQTTSFILTDFSCYEDELKGMVTGLAETLGSDGIIVADTTNINVDPFAYIVYSLGEAVREKIRNHSEYQDETDISDLAECFSYKNHFTFNAEELENLKQFGIERVKEGKKYIFREISPNEGLDDEIFLTDTRFEGRTERIETIKIGDHVKLVRVTNDKSLPKMIEVFSEEGSLGFLDYDASEIMASIIDKGDKKYTAEVYGVIPKSKRAPGRQTAIVSVHIQIINTEEK